MGDRSGLSRNGLNTWNSSGSTAPCTTFSPRPQAPVIRTNLSKPVSVSMENITPEDDMSERTICCTPIDSATSR